MTKEEAKQFYATILSGLLSNDGVGGNIDDKIKLGRWGTDETHYA